MMNLLTNIVIFLLFAIIITIFLSFIISTIKKVVDYIKFRKNQKEFDENMTRGDFYDEL